MPTTVDTVNTKALENASEIQQAPSFLQVVWKEILHDKVALVSLFVLVLMLVSVFVAAQFVNQTTSNKVNLKNMNQAPSAQHILGTDPSGRDMLGQLVVGARNSFMIAFSVTLICGVVGVLVGLISGFFGGHVDNMIMRVIDFMSMLPFLMLIIVLVSLLPKYSVMTFTLIMSSFLWIYDARLVRAKTFQQGNLDYVSASKTLGTANFMIMFREVLPNISSIIIVNWTLNLASNMGLETGLSFLGFGLPFNTPSLGTLLSYASSPENIQKRFWLWLPAALLILVMMLAINFVGQAVKRASDA